MVGLLFVVHLFVGLIVVPKVLVLIIDLKKDTYQVYLVIALIFEQVEVDPYYIEKVVVP